MRAALVDVRFGRPVVNECRNPAAVAPGSPIGSNNNNTTHLLYRGVVPPIPAPHGSTTATLQRRNPDHGSLYIASAYRVDGFLADQPARRVRLHVLCTVDALVDFRTGAPAVAVPAGEWVALEGAVPANAHCGLLAVRADGADADGTEAFYWTEIVTVFDRLPVGYVDGDQPGSRWLGTPHASPSVGYPRP